MRILFVRHGKPDYATDSLTELGRIQAEAVAERLMGEGISEIYSSTMGRAKETAKPFSEKSGLSITPLDFMREISWGSKDGYELPKGGHPWLFLPDYVRAGGSICDADWRSAEAFIHNTRLDSSTKRVADGADAWLLSLGFTREGEYYRVTGENTDKTVVVFSHHGASNTFIAHLFNLPFPLACLMICPYFTSVSLILLEGKPGELTTPRIEYLTDAKHVPRDEGAWIQSKPDK